MGRCVGVSPPSRPVGIIELMDRPSQFEHHRFVGDKRNQRVYDLDASPDPNVISELMESRRYICFGPDTLAEARNRGYRLA